MINNVTNTDFIPKQGIIRRVYGLTNSGFAEHKKTALVRTVFKLSNEEKGRFLWTLFEDD